MQLRLKSNVLRSLLAASFLLVVTGPAAADTATAKIDSITATGSGGSLGTVSFADSPQGLIITPQLSGLTPGQHGFHIHEKGDCGPGMNQGKAAAASPPAAITIRLTP